MTHNLIELLFKSVGLLIVRNDFLTKKWGHTLGLKFYIDFNTFTKKWDLDVYRECSLCGLRESQLLGNRGYDETLINHPELANKQ